tara:strand:- start:104 stop:460 length:357 start_codon:yes stop_codon:yes gene_type:complete
MNKYSVYAWLDDLQMSAQLARLANLHSYDLKFFGDGFIGLGNKVPTVLIIDLLKLSEDDLNKILNYSKTELLTIIGYLHHLTISQMKFYKEYGCHMVIGRKDLLKNLNSIIKKIFYAC